MFHKTQYRSIGSFTGKWQIHHQTVFWSLVVVAAINCDIVQGKITAENKFEQFYRKLNFAELKKRFYATNSKQDSTINNNDQVSYEITSIEQNSKKINKLLHIDYPFLEKYSKYTINEDKIPTREYKVTGTAPTPITNNEFNTGMWAVKLKFGKANASRDWLDRAADNIAEEQGLTNHGQIGELRGYYLFTKKDASKTWTTMASAVASQYEEASGHNMEPTSHEDLDKFASTTDETPLSTEQYVYTTTAESQDVELDLRRHKQVEWQRHQFLLTRSKRHIIPMDDVTDANSIIQTKLLLPSTASVPMKLAALNNVHLNNATMSTVMSEIKLTSTRKTSKPTTYAMAVDEEKERPDYYVRFEMGKKDDVITPATNTKNENYEKLIGREGMGGRRMGIQDDEYESDDEISLSDENELVFSTDDNKLPHDDDFSRRFQDPLYSRQWHLENTATKTDTSDCNVTGVWAAGITGKGVVVAVVDDGVQWDHPDLIDNYCSEGSFDLNANDNDPMPVRDSKEENKHGTRCAGEIAAAANRHCGVGIAHGARFSGIRILDGPLTDSMEAAAFNKHLDINDVYSCSWGPEDDGKTIDGPHPLAQAALKHGVVAGRQGYGSIYIVASGNGGHKGDNCNYDGYANSIYTMTIGAVDEFGRVPSYAEECASMLACTFSSGAGSEDGNARKIVTTDWTLGKSKRRNGVTGCTESHTGTSAATPLAAGMVALMLDARPCLSWRDVQHIVVMTAVQANPDGGDWTINSAGFHHSDKKGFGLLNAWRLVNAARVWRNVPWSTSLIVECPDKRRIIPPNTQRALIVKTVVARKQTKANMINSLEQVLVTVDIEHLRRGDLFLSLVCPSGTTSVIGSPRKNDDSSSGLWNWTFATVKCWGEQPYGTYRLIIHDTQGRRKNLSGELQRWKLTLYGSAMTSDDIEEQRQRVEAAMSGEFLQSHTADFNSTGDNANGSAKSFPVGFCPPSDQNTLETMLLVNQTTTQRTLKMIALSGCFLLLWGLYCSFDASASNTDDKKQTGDKVKVAIIPNFMQYDHRKNAINNFAKDIVSNNNQTT